jgi:hypothetical protein
MTFFFHFGLEERKMSSRLELDLKDFRELRLDLFKKVLHFVSPRPRYQSEQKAGPSNVEAGSQNQSVAIVDHLRRAGLSLWMQGQMRATLISWNPETKAEVSVS